MTGGKRPLLTTSAFSLGWLSAGGLFLIALVRAWGSETSALSIGMQGVAVWLLLPAYGLLCAASVVLVRRRRRRAGALRWPLVLTVVALGLVVAQASLLTSAIGWHGSRAAPAGTTTLRIVSANVLVDNTQIDELADELVATDADIIVLQEVTVEHAATLAASPLWGDYAYRLIDPHPGFHGSAIFSRYAFQSGGPIDVAGSPMIEATIRTPAGPVRLVDVHPVAPIDTENARIWGRQFMELALLAGKEKTPLILAGDFNATLDHAPLRRLVNTGLRDAFVESGSGFGATWPRWDSLIPPVMRLDHVLVSHQITVMSITDQKSAGSDHRRLLVELALPPGD